MRIFVVIGILFALSACERHRVSIYEFNNTSVTRVDHDAETNFYFGKYLDEQYMPKDFIRARYSGRDGVMSNYLIFRKDKSITLVRIAGNFEKVGDSIDIGIFEFQSNLSFIEWENKFKFKYDSIIRIDDAMKLERRVNKENNSKVIATYFP